MKKAPYAEKTVEEIQKSDVEVFVMLKAFDEVFSQTIYMRHSYMHSQFVYGAKFRRPFETNEEGKIVMDVTKVAKVRPRAMPTQVATAFHRAVVTKPL